MKNQNFHCINSAGKNSRFFYYPINPLKKFTEKKSNKAFSKTLTIQNVCKKSCNFQTMHFESTSSRKKKNENFLQLAS